MSTENTCPQCRAPLPSDAPAGLCPRCLIRSAAGLGAPPPEATDVDFPDIGDRADVARRLPQFEILEMLGRGGMGVVYQARQLQLDRLVALKILPPSDALSPDFVERFRREARALAKLNHPNIVSVFEFGEAGGLHYIIMEFVDGTNLRELFETRKLTPAEALAIVPKICDALEYAHEEGIVHRDIKPENILIDKKGRVKIADFGLAKLLRREALDMSLTLSGTSLGTVRYMAPEQMDIPETVDHRADLYSLGVVIYEMLTGDVPVGRFELPSQKAQVDVRLDEIVLHALEREPARRYQHASEVREDVQRVTSTAAVTPARLVQPESQRPAEKTRAAEGFAAKLRAPWQTWCALLVLALCLASVLVPSAVLGWSGTQAYCYALTTASGETLSLAPRTSSEAAIIFPHGQWIAGACALALIVTACGLASGKNMAGAIALFVAGGIAIGMSAHFIATFESTRQAGAGISWHDLQTIAAGSAQDYQHVGTRMFIEEHPGFVRPLTALWEDVQARAATLPAGSPEAVALAKGGSVQAHMTVQPGAKWTLFFGACALLLGLASLFGARRQ
ncbi:MAG TPA: serine/threonine-protein kinase [Chthoniobacteraceae bacterium]|jgi:serine/threonine protein kinase|nr:serine/threonine-protein kinase [Chthoniobacteraceae bacterium]